MLVYIDKLDYRQNQLNVIMLNGVREKERFISFVQYRFYKYINIMTVNEI